MPFNLPSRSLKLLAFCTAALCLFAGTAFGNECQPQHPIMPPDKQYAGQCPVCGMVRSMWARTWITFHPVLEVSQTCSFHCLADWTIKSGREPQNVRLTVYQQPEKSILADNAHIVMGSRAAGTMSPVSKLVFADPSEAEHFAQACGGAVVGYSRALLAAKSSVVQENSKINARRIKKGKIVEPADADGCVVCGMFPKRYPYGKCQIRTPESQTLHFCSSQCLFAFLGQQTRYVQSPVTPFLVWVVDRISGMWISGRTAFYVIGSANVFGPMGHEAFPFAMNRDAERFAAENGGTVAIYPEVRIDRIVPQWQSK